MFRIRGISLIELLLIIAIIGVLAALLSSQLIDARRDALNAACVDKLGKLGKAVNKYNKSFYKENKQELFNLTPEQELQPEATLIPLIELVKAGLITSEKEVTCPVGHGDPVAKFDADPDAPKNLLYYATKKDLKFSDLVMRNRKGEVMSSYLFTYKYQRINDKNRIIAGDAAVADGKVSLGFSRNHGDYVENGKFNFVGGANGLFSDGHVKGCRKDYTIDGATDSNNLWLSGVTGVDPEFKRVKSDIMTEDENNLNLSIIGGVAPEGD